MSRFSQSLDLVRGGLVLLALTLLTGCSGNVASGTPDSEIARSNEASDHETPRQVRLSGSVLRLATTTSTRDSGLLDVLVPRFEKSNACRVDVIAVGTGAALKLGEAGDVDVLLVHARSAEEAFMKAGHGIRHEPIMHNEFIIAGSPDDPARVRGTRAADALIRIAAEKQQFVSRGDDSGTHKREAELWNAAGGRPKWEGYIECGQGMGPTLVIADELNAYVLTDEATWLKQSANFQLVPLVTGAEDLRNPYAAIVVNPETHSFVNAKLAAAFIDFLISAETQRMISAYRINGQVLFHPDRLKRELSE